MSCTSLCNVLQCFGEETSFCDFAVQLCVSTIDWYKLIKRQTLIEQNATVNNYCMKHLHVYMGTKIHRLF